MLPARTTILALTTVTLMAASGCGGSTKTSATTVTAGATPATTTAGVTTGQTNTHPFPVAEVKIAHGKPLSHQQWVRKANAICAHYRRELKHLKIKGLVELPRVLPQESAYLRSETADLAKLTPPAANKNDWQQIVNTVLELAEGGTKVAEIKNAGARIFSTPTGMAFLATRNRLINLSTRNKLPHCAI